MQHFLFATRLSDGREIRIAPISLDAYEANQAHSLGDDTGFFIYEFEDGEASRGVEVLGKAASYEAALRLADMLQGIGTFRPPS